MSFFKKTQRLRHLRNGFSESAQNSELETIFKLFGLRHEIKSGSSHSLQVTQVRTCVMGLSTVLHINPCVD